MVPCVLEQLQACHVVFGRACGAASTTSNIEKSNCSWCRNGAEIQCWNENQHMKKHSQSTKPHARNPSQKVTKNTPNIAPKAPKNHQKSSQNRPLESLWDPLATLLEPRALYVPFMYPIWLHFGPQMGPQNRSKIDHFLNLFLTSFLKPLFRVFCLHLGSQNVTKMTPKKS